MKSLRQLTAENGHTIKHWKECTDADHKYITPFNYSNMYGGAYDSFRYYNDYYIDIGKAL